MPEPRILVGPEAIVEGVRALTAGGLAAFPTETVYGLGARALDPDAVGRVFALKGRPSSNPLIVHVSGAEMAKTVTADWHDDAQTLADAFWPGPLTLVLPKAGSVPESVTAGGPTIAVRCPDHPVALALIEALGEPIVGPSANPSGRVSPTTAEHVASGFAGADLPIIDGGPCRAGIESTVLDLTRETPAILRPGVIGKHAIERALGRSVYAAPVSRGDAPAASPGLLGPHYQPRTPVRLTTDPGGAKADEVVVAWSIPAGTTDRPDLVPIPRDLPGYAATIYAALHRADALAGAGQAERITVEIPAESGDPDDDALRDAIMERLARAASES